MTRGISYLLSIITLLLLCSCKLCYLTDPSCLLAPQGTTNVKANKYYKKGFQYNDTLLSTQNVYELIDSSSKYGAKYWYQSLLFYNTGLVYENDYSTYKLKSDTINAVSQDIVKECCHGASIGTYTVSNDTLLFGVKQGYQSEWNYYRAKILPDRLVIFQAERGKRKDTLNVQYTKNTHAIVLRNRKF